MVRVRHPDHHHHHDRPTTRTKYFCYCGSCHDGLDMVWSRTTTTTTRRTSTTNDFHKSHRTESFRNFGATTFRHHHHPLPLSIPPNDCDVINSSRCWVCTGPFIGSWNIRNHHRIDGANTGTWRDRFWRTEWHPLVSDYWKTSNTRSNVHNYGLLSFPVIDRPFP